MKKEDLNQKIHFSEGNLQSKNTDKYLFLTWSLPCKISCPYATEMCKKMCFAQKNQYFKSVYRSRMNNLEESHTLKFENDVVGWLDYYLNSKKAKDKILVVRIHCSGDFYDLRYFTKWVHIARLFRNDKRIIFQAYTKSLPILHDYICVQKGFHNSNLEDYEIIEDTNIKLVWSVFPDTPKEYTERAKELGLSTFTALPKEGIPKVVGQGAVNCPGDCGHCMECYTGNSKNIVIAYH